ncbi:MAG: hypothetical protein HAW60_01500 [Bdellovibrionales bacterium]|nr:hypothetical protein [Bdellovibrionales bacterium]
MYNFLTIAFLFFLTIIIVSPSGFAKMNYKEIAKITTQINQAQEAKNYNKVKILAAKLNSELGYYTNSIGGGYYYKDIGGGQYYYKGGDGISGGIGVLPIKKSICLESLKQHSIPNEFGGAVNGRNLIMDPNYTLSYRYNDKTKKYSPVLTKITNDSVTVVSPNGTAITSGRSCTGDKSETSNQLLSKWIQQSGEKVEKNRKFGRSLKSAKEKKSFFKSIAHSEKQRKKILKICSSSKIGVISIAAKKALKNSIDSGGWHRASKHKGTK